MTSPVVAYRRRTVAITVGASMLAFATGAGLHAAGTPDPTVTTTPGPTVTRTVEPTGPSDACRIAIVKADAMMSMLGTGLELSSDMIGAIQNSDAAKAVTTSDELSALLPRVEEGATEYHAARAQCLGGAAT